MKCAIPIFSNLQSYWIDVSLSHYTSLWVSSEYPSSVKFLNSVMAITSVGKYIELNLWFLTSFWRRRKQYFFPTTNCTVSGTFLYVQAIHALPSCELASVWKGMHDCLRYIHTKKWSPLLMYFQLKRKVHSVDWLYLVFTFDSHDEKHLQIKQWR